jgi:WD40 repeat protein
MDMNEFNYNRVKKFPLTGTKPFIWLVLLFLFAVKPSTDAQENTFLIHTFSKHSDVINSIDVHPEKELLVTGSKDQKIMLWDLREKKDLLSLDENTAEIQCVTFSPDGKYLVGSDRNIVRVWTVEGEYINSLSGHATAVWSIDFNPAGDRIVTGSFDRTFKLWDFINLTELSEFEGHSKSALSVAFHPMGNLIASGSLDETIRLWDMTNHRVIHTFKGHSGNIYSLDFSPDGKYLISASRDHTIKLWDVEKKELIRTFEGHTGAVFNAVFSPEGDHLLSGSVDQSIKLWETSTGNCLHTFTGHEGAVSSVAFLPNGKSFVSGSYDKTAKLWQLGPELFVDYYFKKEIEDEMKENPVFQEKSRSESRQEYAERMEVAKKQREQLYQKYYRKYIEQLKNNTLKNEE